MEEKNRHHGSLVALEGPEHLISTQLRLLPASPQLLVLPSLQHYMKGISDTHFSARSYIKHVHQAARARHDAASRFLNESTGTNKRLVFLHGGTTGAVSQCIAAISEHQASGDAILAEAIYRNIASEGVSGLDLEEKLANHEAFRRLSSGQDQDEMLWEGDLEDPITKAMRAVDALYKETDSLQPMDCYIRTRPRSLSLPMLDYAIGMGEASPFFVFGSSPSEGTGSVYGEEDNKPPMVNEQDESKEAHVSKAAQSGAKLRISVPHRPGSSMVEAIRTHGADCRSTLQLPSPAVDSFLSPPITPEGVVYGEARLVQMAASNSQQKLRETRSLDDMELVEARQRRVSDQTVPLALRALDIDSPEAKSRHLSIVEDPYSPNNLLHLPQAQFVKAQTTTIRRSPTFPRAVPEPARDTYVHQGTDVADFDNDDLDVEEEDEFEPVLPMHEDLVIHFTDFSRDYILDSVMQSFKDGSYPVPSNKLESVHTADTDSCPSTPSTAELFDLERGLSPVAEVPSADEMSDYEPCATHSTHVRWGSAFAQHPRTQPPRGPPTPAQTPTPHAEAHFHELCTAHRSSALATQNALRDALERYFPQQAGAGYALFRAAALPDMDRLWRPIFPALATRGPQPGQPSVDLVLAIGCQAGVKDEFVTAVTGQIEKLGSKENGTSRSGRLDIRYVLHSGRRVLLRGGIPADNPTDT